jgi:minor extracellular serine protease Vpr
MSGSGNPPPGFSYGTEYTKAQLDANQCLQIDGDDGHGHGTHVAGTAAGNGGALTNYIGMAPESDILFVKGFRSGPGFANTDIVDGCNYMFQRAQQIGKPAVINLSLGGHFGPHDGSSLYEQALSNMTGNGKDNSSRRGK